MRKLITVALILSAAPVFASDSKFATEFAQRWARTRKLAVGVADAMPPVQYEFRPDPGSMTFAEQLTHIAKTDYQFCAGLKDAPLPSQPNATDKASLTKYLADSFDYCSGAITSVTEEQMNQVHNSPDGRLNGRELLLALYVHMAHHRGQLEVYLRIKGIAPPSYVF